MEAAAAIVTITGERVALGPLRRDLVPLYARWMNDFTTQRTLGGLPRPRAIEELVALFERGTAADGAQFGIHERATGRPIGITELQQIDFRHRTATFVIFIGEPELRGRGYGTEATRLMLDYAFAALGLHNVMLTVSAFNLAGQRAYAKAGFREFGRRRACREMGGRRWDDIYMECLATEFDGPARGDVFAPGARR